MSIVLAAKDGDKTYIGCDSIIVFGDNKFISKQSKVIRKLVTTCTGDTREMLIGTTGSPRPRAVFHFKVKLPEHDTENMDDYEYISTVVVDELVNEMEKAGCMGGDSEYGISIVGTNFIIVYNNHIYLIDEVFCVLEPVDNIMVIGSGTSYAIGALRALQRQSGFIEASMLSASLKVTEEFCTTVCGPFHIYTVIDNKVHETWEVMKK